ncbi:Hypothetical protein IALB_1273 [Ignavibacterium album JCM 16511]|uniref:DUF4296 domain-containing protein n=1 Tax=Ignavibacterium album (strain DSM 19864 / JCM 16511 / NBRC 101810 / Mat9-16) TaxID=945713 RepID=I0AJ26_IGNAJ|nr:Hypothetical protein IALB_1273 [Ignavibacterium album JCM 16511]
MIACKERPPITEDKFVQIYANLVSAPDSISVDSLMFADYKQKVFSNYGFSEKNYEQTVKFYNQTPEKWEEFFRKVIKYIESTNDSSKSEI